MKQSEVVIGGRYFANIGAELAPVIVVALVEPSSWDKGGHTRFSIRREGSSSILSKPRTAAALRLENRKKF